MKYTYKRLTLDSYLTSLYEDGFNKSSKLNDNEIKNSIENIGIFKFKGYVKAFRQDVSKFSIDDIINLYSVDREISSKIFELSSSIEIRLKAYLIDIVYNLTDNPFFYLIEDNYSDEFSINNDSLYDWEVKPYKRKQKSEVYLHYRDYYLENYDYKLNKEEYLSSQNLINLNETLDINYPPFHYFIENITLGALIKIISKLNINDHSILKHLANKFNMYDAKVFLNYLLRLKEIRNRCAHNGRLFNRNYRGVKAYGIHKKFRETIYEHKLIDVYYSLCILLEDTKDINIVDDLIEKFKNSILVSCDDSLKEFMINIMKTR
ncbi:MAG: Abi family protein [Campylobacterota bacterium]|nr:Abi family protein [Campylobacterota bacterium]